MESTTDDPPRHQLSVLVRRMRARLGEDAPASMWSMPDGELGGLLDDLHGLAAQVESVTLAAVREADRRDLGAAAGATSTATWLSGRLRIRPEVAARATKLARALDSMLPVTQQALRAGEISADHAGVVARAVRDLPHQCGPRTRVEAEQALVSYARMFHPKILSGLARKVLETAAPNVVDEALGRKLAAEEARAARTRELSLHDDPHGPGSWIRGRVDPVTAELMRTALEPLAKPMPTTADGPDVRNHSQRLGDAFAELLRRYLDSGRSPTHAGEKPHLILTVGADDLRDGTGTATLLHTDTLVSTRTAAEWACDAKVSWYAESSRSAEDNRSAGGGGTATRAAKAPTLSDAVRLFSGKTRRLLELRDRGCAFPGCDRPSAWCHAHHVLAWIRGGPTTVDNGVLLCGYHHRLIHQGAWQVRIADDGLPEFIPPDWVDKRREPLRGHRLRS